MAGGHRRRPSSPSREARPGTSGGQTLQARRENLSAVSQKLRANMYVSSRVVPSDDDVVAAIEGWLKLPATTGGKEEDFADRNTGEDGQASDPTFPTNSFSLLPDPSQPPAHAPSEVAWLRVTGYFMLSSGRPVLIQQGTLQNAWFLGALGAVAMKADLLLELVLSDEYASKGLYTFQFYKHGCWHPVVVDNFLPCTQTQDRLLFASSAVRGELWPSLLEKAYAKLHGSYFALDEGSVGDALVDLTGGVAIKINLNRSEDKEEAASGALWGRLCSWCGGRSIVVGVAKGDEPPAPGASQLAIRPNVPYVVTAAQQSADGNRMLQVHCPVRAEEEASTSGAETHGPTWMPYWEFVETFNRLHIVELFPRTWHQLTLHCGWYGPTAGGPLRDAASVLSSTWCCNPQFRLTMRKACEVVLCMGQRDPRVMYSRHVPKRDRQESFGVVVVSMPEDYTGRCWEVAQTNIVADTGLGRSREATLRFKGTPGTAYMAIPYAGKAGQEGPFVLRMFSSAPLEVEQLPSPYSLVVGGQWSDLSAGGGRSSPSWGSNPQFLISVQHRTPVLFSLCRVDVRYAVIPQEVDPAHALGIVLTRPEIGEEGLNHRTALHKESDVVAGTPFDNTRECTLLADLHPEAPYLVVPCTAVQGLEAPFELRIMSSIPVELVPMPQVKHVSLAGQWREETAGGCDLHPQWRKNPRFLVMLTGKAKCRLTVAHAGREWKRNQPLEDMIGFYLLKASYATGQVEGDMRKAMLAEAPFVPMQAASAEFELHADVPYLVMPATYAPGRLGKFTVTAAAPVNLTMRQL